MRKLDFKEAVHARCEEINSKWEFTGFVRQLIQNNFQDTLTEVVRYMFVPSREYRRQLVRDLIEQVNQVVKVVELR